MSRPVIFAWAIPRSVSTAFEKALSRHSKVDVEHEPFTKHYYFVPRRKSDRYLYSEEPETDQLNPGCKISRNFEASESIKAASAEKLLIVKELAFQGEPYVSDSTLALAQHILIGRDPRKVYSSLVRIKPDFSENEFGFTAMERLCRRLIGIGKQPLGTIDGTTLQSKPESVLSTVCDWLDLPFEDDMTRWEDGRIRIWRNDEGKSQAPYHRTLEASKGFVPPRPAELVAPLPVHAPSMERAETIFNRIFVKRQNSFGWSLA